MALNSNFSHAGLSVDNGYLRVGDFQGSKSGISFVLSYYADVNEVSVKEETFSFVPDMDSNFIAQAYNHLKTLPDFANAVDC